jgi:hypothetical protein
LQEVGVAAAILNRTAKAVGQVGIGKAVNAARAIVSAWARVGVLLRMIPAGCGQPAAM